MGFSADHLSEMKSIWKDLLYMVNNILCFVSYNFKWDLDLSIPQPKDPNQIKLIPVYWFNPFSDPQ